MSTNTERTCSNCGNVAYVGPEQQRVCMHGDVSQISFKRKLIGLDADTCRSSKRDCGPTARWWKAEQPCS